MAGNWGYPQPPPEGIGALCAARATPSSLSTSFFLSHVIAAISTDKLYPNGTQTIHCPPTTHPTDVEVGQRICAADILDSDMTLLALLLLMLMLAITIDSVMVSHVVAN